MRGLFITGTDTGVGKTLVATLLTSGFLERGVPAIHFKPVQSGFVSFHGKELPADLLFSWSIVAPKEDPAAYCAKRSFYAFREPIAPDHAAEKEKIVIDPALIVARARELDRNHILISEGAGGVAVPLRESYVGADLIADLGQKALVVARPGLGTLNHSRLTVEFLRHRGVKVVGIVVSGYMPGEETADRNIAQLPCHCGVPLFGVIPRILGLDTERPGWLSADTTKEIVNSFDWEKILVEVGP